MSIGKDLVIVMKEMEKIKISKEKKKSIRVKRK